MAELLPILKQRFLDDNGDPLAGGKLYTYVAGTSTPLATYTDSTAATPNTNPIILDSSGYCDVWIEGGLYKLVLHNANDEEVFSVDNISRVSEGPQGASFRVGAGVPSSLLGIDGDSYLRTSNGDIYTKSGGAWAVTTTFGVAADAAASAAAAALSEAAAELAETNAETAEANAETAQAAAEAARDAAISAQAAAELAETNAETAETNAEIAATSAASSATAADASADAAAISEANAAASASGLATHEADTSTHGVATIAGLTEAQVFTNKDYDGGTASNTSRITIPKNTKANLDALTRKEGTVVYATDLGKFYYDNGTDLTEVGSGSGSGGINYIENPDAETDTTGWATYNDSVQAFPVDGTGGGPESTFTRTTSSPLRGTASFLFSKAAGNQMAEGFSCDFTIDDADKAKALSISFDYEVDSGTYATGDVTLWIYDVTNATLIQPSGSSIQNVGIESKHIATFQTASNSTSYRLIGHVTTTSASAYALKFDNFQVGPESKFYGAPVTDWTSYTHTMGAATTAPTSGTVSVNSAYWKRVGDSMHIKYMYRQTSAGGAGSGIYRFYLPAGYSMDTTKLSLGSSYTQIVGSAYTFNGTNEGTGHVFAAGTNYFHIYTAHTNGTAYGQVGSAWYPMSSTNLIYTFEAVVPIVGWSSSVVCSNDTDTRVCSFRATNGSTQALTANVTRISATVVKDSHGAWDGDEYVVQVPGDYVFTLTTADNGGTPVGFDAYKNSVIYDRILTSYATSSGQGGPGNLLITNLIAGDRIDFRCNSAVTARPCTIAGFRLSGPSAISASESISARYVNTAGTSIANTGFDILVPFATKDFNSHDGSWVTDTYTVLDPGKYEVRANLSFNTATYAVGNLILGSVYKNGSAHTYGPITEIQSAVDMYVSAPVVAEVNCVTGDTLQIKVGNNRTAGATALNTGAGYCNVVIKRVGN